MSETRECTCHPDEAPVPCQHGYALSECLKRKNDHLRAQNAELLEALRPLACTCEAESLEEGSRSEHRCAFWNARAVIAKAEKEIDE